MFELNTLRFFEHTHLLFQEYNINIKRTLLFFAVEATLLHQNKLGFDIFIVQAYFISFTTGYLGFDNYTLL
jgi:hypothetical protein